MNCFHIQGVAENEFNVFIPTKVRQPVPPKHAFRTHNQVLAKRLDGVKEVGWLRSHITMQPLVPLMIENAQVHSLGVQVHATIERMLLIIESHDGLLRLNTQQQNGTQRKASRVQGRQ